MVGILPIAGSRPAPVGVKPVGGVPVSTMPLPGATPQPVRQINAMPAGPLPKMPRTHQALGLLGMGSPYRGGC